jgi:hypothetical protein
MPVGTAAKGAQSSQSHYQNMGNIQ